MVKRLINFDQAPTDEVEVVPQYSTPTAKHEQIVRDLIDAGATPADAIRIVAERVTATWDVAKSQKGK